jgi:hypothetical protein
VTPLRPVQKLMDKFSTSKKDSEPSRRKQFLDEWARHGKAPSALPETIPANWKPPKKNARRKVRGRK